MARWVQMGVFSPVLRPHCAGRGGNQRDIWRFDWPAFMIMRDYFRLRARLVPYLAAAQRIAYDTGVVPVHPLYYEYPSALHAYSTVGLHQHAFGSDIWVAPITTPAPHGSGGLAQSEIWFPPGAWIEWFSWQVHVIDGADGAIHHRRFSLSESPVFSPAGAIIPLRTLPGSGSRTGEGDAVGTAVDVPEALTLWIMPPAPRSLTIGVPLTFSTRIYDDDGVSVAYAAVGAFRWTNVTCVWLRANASSILDAGAEGLVSTTDSVRLSVYPGGGDGFGEMPLSRSWTLRFVSTWPPATVSVGGILAVPHQAAVPDAWGDNAAWPTSAAPSWAYAGTQASTWVHVGAAVPVDAALDVELTFPSGAPADDPVLTSALARKVSRGQAAKRELNTVGGASASDAPGVLRVAGTGAVVEAAVAGAHPTTSSSPTGGWQVPDRRSLDGAMIEAVRSAYSGLDAALHSALRDTGELLHHGPVIDSMRALLENALE